MTVASRPRHAAALGTGLAALLALALASLAWGSVALPLGAVWDVLLGRPAGDPAWADIVWTFRMPRTLTAILVGAGLSAAGLMMQTLFRNPLAGPFVLGINAGASLGVALVVLAAASSGFAWLGQIGAPGAWTLVVAATLGAGALLALVLMVAARVEDAATLLILGLMFASATAALVSILQYFSEAERIQAYLVWTFGNLGGVTWRQLPVLAVAVTAGGGLALGLVKPLNALLLGEHYARSMGARVRLVRALVIAATSLLAGAITAFCGPIAFLGLAVPHLVRALFNTADHVVLMPFSCLAGALLMLACDLIARLPGSALSLPINAVTALFGAPVVVWVILRRRTLPF